MTITTAQIRGARGILNWSQQDLSDRTDISTTSIGSIEKGTTKARASTLEVIRKAFELAGIEFTDGGMRQRREYLNRLQGVDGFKQFMDMVYDEAKTNGGNFCIFNASPSQWTSLVDDEWQKMHIERMTEVFETGDLNFKITCPNTDQNMIGSKYAEYRVITENKWSERSFYVFGQYIGILIFKKNDVEIILFKEQAVASTFLYLFNIAWETIAKKPNE